MPTLKPTHKGWENEHLATFLLSRIAFVARPITVADDLGTDLFCTLFEIVNVQEHQELFPRNSMAVQVKSSADSFDVTNKLSYLSRLELPFYLGVVDQHSLSMSLYSGRYLANMLSLRGNPKKLIFSPVAGLVGTSYKTGDDARGYTLMMPHVVTLEAKDTPEQVQGKADAIQSVVRASLNSIVSRLNNEFIFEIPGGIEIFTGPGSAKTFYPNFLKRLAEALYNLAWLIENGHNTEVLPVETFQKMYEMIPRDEVQPYLQDGYERLLNAQSSSSNRGVSDAGDASAPSI